MEKTMLESLAVKLAEKLVPILVPIIVEKLSALLPVIAATIAKTVMDQFQQPLPDLQIPHIADLAENVRQQVNMIPEIDIPVLSDMFSGWLKTH
jgi:hypothetical protein